MSKWYDGIIEGAGLPKSDLRLLFRKVMFSIARNKPGGRSIVAKPLSMSRSIEAFNA